VYVRHGWRFLFCHAWRFPIFEIRHGWRFLAGFSDLALPLGSLFLEDDLVIGHSVETDPGPALCNGRCAGCCGGRGRLAGPAYRGPGWPGRSHRRAAAHAGAQGSRAWPPLPRPAPGAKKEPQGGSSCGSICCVVLCWPDLIAPVAGPKTDTLGISVAGLCRSKHTETEPPIDSCAAPGNSQTRETGMQQEHGSPMREHGTCRPRMGLLAGMPMKKCGCG